MFTSLMPNPKQQFFDNNGLPLVNGNLYTYAAGTTNPLPTYTDVDGTTPQPNPIPLNVRGEPASAIFWAGAYYVELRDALGNLIYSVDDYTAPEDISASGGAGMIGFDYSATYLAGTLGKWLQDLANSAGATFIGYLQAGAGAVLRTVRARLRDKVSVFDFMTTAQIADVLAYTYSLDVTNSLNAAYTYGASIGADVEHPGGGYLVTPATLFADEDVTYPTYAAFLMKSNLHVRGGPGVVFKMANGVSTDASPKSIGFFCTNEVLSNVSIVGIDFDGNGANNLISPLRPASYNRYNQAFILVSGTPGGVAARIDDMLVENCTFRNNAGVCDIVCAQSNVSGTILGKRWVMRNNKFKDNGLDTDDHTAVFAWVDDALFFGNEFSQTFKLGQVGRTGGNTCYEIHGSRHRLIGNDFRDYYRGVWVSSNLTAAETNDSLIIGNNFYTLFYGVDFFRSTATLSQPRNTIITGNTFRFDSYTFPAPVPQQKSAVQVASEYAQQDIHIFGNMAFTSDTVVGSVFLTITPQAVAGQTHSNITCKGNKATGFVLGCNIRSNAVNGLGLIAIEGNEWIDPIPNGTFGTTFGEFIDPVSPISTLILRNNSAIDTRAVPLGDYGTYIQTGTITDLHYDGCFVKGVTTQYLEAGAVAGNKSGTFENLPHLPVFRAGGTAFTLVDGTRNGLYTIRDDEVTIHFTYDVGAGDTIPVGDLTADLPITSGLSNYQFMGTWRIFDSGPNIFHFGVAEVDGTASQLSFQEQAGTFATSALPVALGGGDRISVQLTYKKP